MSAATMNELVNSGWKTPNAYTDRAFGDIPPKPGLYLFRAIGMTCDCEVVDEVVYVGMSRCLAQRVRGHEVAAAIPGPFQIWFKPLKLERAALLSEERRHIAWLKPRFNIIGKQDPVRAMRVS